MQKEGSMFLFQINVFWGGFFSYKKPFSPALRLRVRGEAVGRREQHVRGEDRCRAHEEGLPRPEEDEEGGHPGEGARGGGGGAHGAGGPVGRDGGGTVPHDAAAAAAGDAAASVCAFGQKGMYSSFTNRYFRLLVEKEKKTSMYCTVFSRQERWEIGF